ncbi:MAG: hypothetical protein DWQ31_15215 [Planctomycetota bacterium]|nr:MAG: hypothetical protein DWQ31_15215 [Planctomycetota bacterium]REJ88310.1 MAG: hypothetical protein DWQ35_20265 [Planctomycetota bacterium]
MSTLHLAIALGPLAVYCLTLGLINRVGRPVMTNGTREIYAVGLAVSGLVFLGPLTLFVPEAVAENIGVTRFNTIVGWGFMVLTYLLGLTLFVLLSRQRLVVYNVSVDQVRMALDSLLRRHNLEHEWAGDALAIAPLGVQLQVDSVPRLRNVSLVATTGRQNYLGWRHLERELALELTQFESAPGLAGVVFLSVGVATLVALAFGLVAQDPSELSAALQEILLP